MKKLFSVLIFLYLIQSILSQCYKQNPSAVSDCEKSKSGDNYCCFVEFRTNLNSTYKKVCIPVKEDDIKDGKFEETMGTIEGGNYTGSGWSEEIMNNFRDYASISQFDCKGNRLSDNIMLFSLMLIIILF